MADASTYSDVRRQTMSAVAEVTALFPPEIEYVARAEQDPYMCGGDAPLIGGPEGTAFFAERGEAVVPEGFDAEALLRSLPEQLGTGWEASVPSPQLPFVALTLTHTADGVNVDVDASTIEGVTLINIAATSPCGRLESDQRHL